MRITNKKVQVISIVVGAFFAINPASAQTTSVHSNSRQELNMTGVNVGFGNDLRQVGGQFTGINMEGVGVSTPGFPGISTGVTTILPFPQPGVNVGDSTRITTGITGANVGTGNYLEQVGIIRVEKDLRGFGNYFPILVPQP